MREYKWFKSSSRFFDCSKAVNLLQFFSVLALMISYVSFFVIVCSSIVFSFGAIGRLYFVIYAFSGYFYLFFFSTWNDSYTDHFVCGVEVFGR